MSSQEEGNLFLKEFLDDMSMKIKEMSISGICRLVQALYLLRRDNLIDIYFKIERNILKNIEKISTDHAYTIIYTFGKLMEGLFEISIFTKKF